MNFRTRTLTSVIVMATLLAFVCLSWTRPQSADAASQVDSSRTHQVFRAGPASLGRYLAEVKPRISAIGSAAIVALDSRMVDSLFDQRRDDGRVQLSAPRTTQRPLWLVNRALLI